jgi:hypothetical protein
MEEIIETLCFALRYAGRKRVHHADEMMARITAERLAEHMRRSGLTVLVNPPAAPPSTSRHIEP